jgi:hypothetical protein
MLQYEKHKGKWQEQCCLDHTKAWSGRHGAYLKEAPKQGWRCTESWLWMRVSLLNIPRYIFIVRRLSILSKLDSNNPYRIWAELYFSNLNYLIILDTLPSWPSRCSRRSRFTSWSYLSFGPILFAAHLLVWPSYGDNSAPPMDYTLHLHPRHPPPWRVQVEEVSCFLNREDARSSIRISNLVAGVGHIVPIPGGEASPAYNDFESDDVT